MIIGISGKFRSGKDTVALMVSEYFQNKKLETERIAFADSVREVVEIISGKKRQIVDDTTFSVPVLDFTIDDKNTYLEEWGLTIGEMLQKVGTDAMRDNFDKDVWVKSAFNKMKDEKTVYLISDVRFPNEAERIKEEGGWLIRIEGDPLNVRDNVKRSQKHESETALDEYKDFDIVITNDGTLEDLKKKVTDFLDLHILMQFIV